MKRARDGKSRGRSDAIEVVVPPEPVKLTQLDPGEFCSAILEQVVTCTREADEGSALAFLSTAGVAVGSFYKLRCASSYFYTWATESEDYFWDELTKKMGPMSPCTLEALHCFLYRIGCENTKADFSNVSRDLFSNGCALCGYEHTALPDWGGEEDDELCAMCIECQLNPRAGPWPLQTSVCKCGYVHNDVTTGFNVHIWVGYARELVQVCSEGFTHENWTPFGKFLAQRGLNCLPDTESLPEVDTECDWHDECYSEAFEGTFTTDPEMWLALSLAANPAMGSLVFKDHTRACQLSGKDPSEKYDPPGTIELYNIYRRKL